MRAAPANDTNVHACCIRSSAMAQLLRNVRGADKAVLQFCTYIRTIHSSNAVKGAAASTGI